MKIIEKKEWLKEVTCHACTSVIEIEFGDLSTPAASDHPITWECCVCGTKNVIVVNDIPKSRVVPHRAPPHDPFEDARDSQPQFATAK